MTILQFHSNSLLHLAKCSLLDYWQKKLFRFNRSSAVENRFRAFFFLCFRRFCPCPQPSGAPCPNVSRVDKSPANIRIWPRKFEFQDLRISGRKEALVISSLKVYEYVATWKQIKSWMSYRSWGLRCAKRLWRWLSSSFPSHRDALTTGLVKKAWSASFLGCLFLVLLRCLFHCFEVVGLLSCLIAFFFLVFGTLRRRRAPSPICLRIVFLKNFFREQRLIKNLWPMGQVVSCSTIGNYAIEMIIIIHPSSIRKGQTDRRMLDCPRLNFTTKKQWMSEWRYDFSWLPPGGEVANGHPQIFSYLALIQTT